MGQTNICMTRVFMLVQTKVACNILILIVQSFHINWDVWQTGLNRLAILLRKVATYQGHLSLHPTLSRVAIAEA